jgi:hypothetical protein
MLGKFAAPCGGIHRPQAFRQRPLITHPAQCKNLVTAHERLDGATKFRPKLDLARDRSLRDFSSHSSVED